MLVCVVACVPLVAWCLVALRLSLLSAVGCCVLRIVCSLLFVVCWSLFVVRCVLIVCVVYVLVLGVVCVGLAVAWCSTVCC